MNDLDLAARLHDLADDLGGPHDRVAPETVIALYRRRRRTRAGLIATVAAVVAIAVGVPAAVGSLSSDGEVAVPTPSVTATTPAAPTTATPTGKTTAPTRSTRPADTSPEPEHVAELEEVAAGLPAVTLTAPELWDQWLPEGRPYPQSSIDEDALTCPRLSARLAEVTGQEMSYWSGTLPNSPNGCTWVEVPLDAVNNVYDYFITVGFTADGTTVDDFRRFREGPGQGTHHCPWVDLPSVAAGSLLVRCASPDSTSYALVVPDTRVDGGLWILSVSGDDAAAVRPAAILPVLVEGVVAEFG
ncbi:hypothetical protein GCM10010531_33420 [Blastococcus jejuensis]|uniref:DUF3558 domain-containing protein n=1 Tax=Blastococcus jejuensis TaxID=351224 RepID=A0ABP6PFD3_9ACTN